MSVEETLQNQHGGNLIDDGAVFGAWASGGVQVAVGFAGSQALVPEMDREAGFLSQDLGEGLGLGGLRTLVSGHVEGVANDDLYTAIFADEPGERFQVLLTVATNKSEDRLRGEAKGIRNRDAYAAISDVETHEAGDRSIQ